MKRLAFALLALAMIASSAAAQCSGGNCRVAAPSASAVPAGYVRATDGKLYKLATPLFPAIAPASPAPAKPAEVKKAAADPCDASVCKCPCVNGGECTCVTAKKAVPAPPVVKPLPAEIGDTKVYQGPLPTGVNWLGLTHDQEVYSFKGQPTDRKGVMQAIGASESDLVDDTAKLIVTVIGPDAERKAALTSLRSQLGDGYRYWDSPPGDWSLAVGFDATAGPVGIYCQAPTGAVLHHQKDIVGGVEASIEAIRKAKGDYDASKDPDRRKAAPAPAGGNASNALLWIGLGVITFLVLTRQSPAK